MSAEFAVLGLLVEQPLHGYAIEQLIEERGMRNWTPIGFSSIYQILDQIAANGWARVRTEPAPGRGKERRVHSVTAEGRRHWETEAMSALADVDAGAGEFLIALSGLPFLEMAGVRGALMERLGRLESRLADLDRDLAAAGPVPSHVEAMFAFVASRLTSEQEWTRSYLTDLTAAEETT